MTWTEYYENINEWPATMAVEQLCNLTQMGSSDQVADAVYSVSLEDEALASRVLDKANEFGVRFTGEDLLTLLDVCEEDSFVKAMENSAPWFKKDDLLELYGAIEDDWLIEIIKKHHLEVPDEILEEYEEQLDDGTDKPITWKYFYDRFYEWSSTYAKKKLEDVTQLGPASQVFEVLTEIFMDDEAGASQFLNRAAEEGITFSKDDFSELNMLCDYDSVRRAVLASGAKFKAKDLEYLYGEIEDDIIIEVAEKYKLMLPEDLREEVEEDSDEELEEDFDEEELAFTNDEIKQEIASTIEWADLAINALVQANNCMNTAGNWGLVDMLGGGFFSSFAKHSSAEEAEQWINQAQGYLECMNNGLEVILQNKASHLRFSALEIVVDMWMDDNFMDCLVQLHIGKVQKRISKAIRQVENVRNELAKSYKQL